MSEDFITFGRTYVYFVNDLFEVDYGIVTGILDLKAEEIPAEIDGIPLRVYTPLTNLQYLRTNSNNDEEVGYYILHKLPNTKNEYEYLYILRKYFYFDKNCAELQIIKKLKDYIMNSCNDYSVTVQFKEPPSTVDNYMYVYYSDVEDIFEDRELGLTLLNTEDTTDLKTIIANSDYYNKYYKLIVRLGNIIYKTPITKASIFNGQLNEIIIYPELLKPIQPPKDYYTYRINMYNTPDNVKYVQFTLNYPNTIISVAKTDITEVQGVSLQDDETMNLVSINRLVPFEENNKSLLYYIPNKTYDLYLTTYDENNKLIEKMKYTSSVEFDPELTVDYTFFKKMEE